jgi:hypothetical protein
VVYLTEERRLKVFENSVLRRIIGPKGDKTIGGWRKLHDEELRNLHFCMRWAGHIARMGRECIEGFGGKSRKKETIRNT